MSGSHQHGRDEPAGAFVTGEWRVEPSRNLLVRGEQQVRVEPRVMDVLVRLASAAGHVVSKEQLVTVVWAGRYVGDDVLAASIYGLRKALAAWDRKNLAFEVEVLAP